MSLDERLDPELDKKLAALRPTLPRSAEKAALGRAAFLAQAQSLASTVSKSGKQRPNGWMHAIQSIFAVPKKEHSPMFSPIITILIAVSLVLGGGGLTVVGAQSSQPDQPLYAVKLFSEQARLQLTSDSDAAFQLQLEFTERRAAEIQSMLQKGQIPSEAVQSRYQNQIEQTLQLAAGMADPKAVQALEQIRLRLQNQQQAFLQLNLHGNPEAESALIRLQQMIQQRLQWVEEGLADLARLRQQFQQQNKQQGGNGGQVNPSPAGRSTMPGNPGMGGSNPWTTGTPTPGSGYGPGPGTGECMSCTPKAGGTMGNPWTTGTPTPGSSYGGGMDGNPWTTGTPTPGSNYGGGMGGNPSTTGTPTPGTGYGPGPGQNPTQTQGAGTGSGPMPTQPDPGTQPTSGMGGGGGMRP